MKKPHCKIELYAGRFGSSKAPISYSVRLKLPNQPPIELQHFIHRTEATMFATYLAETLPNAKWTYEKIEAT